MRVREAPQETAQSPLLGTNTSSEVPPPPPTTQTNAVMVKLLLDPCYKQNSSEATGDNFLKATRCLHQ